MPRITVRLFISLAPTMRISRVRTGTEYSPSTGVYIGGSGQVVWLNRSVQRFISGSRRKEQNMGIEADRTPRQLL
jgi:hypothetical protein